MERDQMSSARRYFETVDRMRPDAPIGATWVALTHWFDIQRGWTDNVEDSRRLATEWAEKAAESSDEDGQAQTVLSHVYLMNRQFDEALAAGEKAVATRPACANANAFFANILHYCGRHEDAIRHVELAIRSHPLNPPFFRNVLAAACRGNGDLPSAISAAKATIEQSPADVPARLILVSAYVQSGENELARSVAEEIGKLDPSFSLRRFSAAQSYRDAGFAEQFASELRSAGLPD
jgi:adenylate cyclase